MRYEGKIYRPGPTEYDSYLLQVTFGCSHNKCTFCNYYRDTSFRVRPYEELEEDIMMARSHYKNVPGVFLIDGNVTCLNMDRLRPILKKIKEVFPESDHTNMFGRFSDLYGKTLDELKEMRELGVKMIYAGLESGSDIVLSDIKKGYTADIAIAAGQRAHEAGISLGTGAILGLGGIHNSQEHVTGTIRVLNEIKSAHIVGLMVLSLQTDSPLIASVHSGEFELPTYRQIFWEELEIVKALQFEKPTVFFSGVYMPDNGMVAAVLPDDKEKLVRQLEMRPRDYPHLLDEKIRMNGSL
ncbi:MAG: radical SAM protein [Spirochaetes bacterium]|nr:radical SAM protein [Spirochaetota bacterium]